MFIYMHWLGKVDEPLQRKCAAHIRRRQLADGGWNIFIGGPSEINASVKAYFALKLAGDSPNAAWMREARANVLRLGGIPQINTYGKLYLALLGQFPWQYLPTIPPEIFLFPNWFFFNLYEMSSWSRTIIAPLTILNHYKPTRTLPSAMQLHELYPAGLENTNLSLKKHPRFWAWRNFFLRCDKLLKIYDSFPIHPLRRRALKAAETWMVERMGEGSEGLSAIFPAMLNAMMALRVLGYPDDHPLVEESGSGLRRISSLTTRRTFASSRVSLPSGTRRSRPSPSPSRDFPKAILPWKGPPPIWRTRKCASKETGPCTSMDVEPSGWAFEHENKYYPDTDDTMMVLMALRHVAPADPVKRSEQTDRALKWLLAFQCEDGGWAAFDKDVTASWLEHVPFADHNAILDPTCSDLTGRVLELLGTIGFDRQSIQVRRAVAMIRRTQETDGSWYGRWGVNYIYGTWQILRGLAAVGENMDQEWIRRGRDWLESCQNDDGGWGETCESYNFPALKGRGPSTPSQTAWAVMGLCACGDASLESIRRGIEFLLRTQNEDGSWTEDFTTGTGFPCVFYLKYDMYRQHFPLLALSTFRKML